MRNFLLGFGKWDTRNRKFNIGLAFSIFIFMAVYAAAFPFTIRNYGPAIRLFCIFINMPAAIFWGIRGGIATGFLTIALNLTLHIFFDIKFEGGAIGPVMAIVAIIIVGRLSDLGRELEEKLDEIQIVRDALRTSETKFRKLFEMESDAIFLISNETGQIFEVNTAATQMYGYTREELLKMRNVDVSAEPKDTRSATKEQRDNIPVRYHRKKDGTVFPVEITASHFIWEGIEVHIAAIRDITFRMEAEQERKQLLERLQRAEKMEALGTLAGGVAHDLNNILVSLVGYPDLLLMSLPDDSPLQDSILTIKNSGLKAANIVEDLLTLTRRGVTVQKIIDMNQIVSDYLKSPEFNKLLSFHLDVKVTVHLENDPLYIVGSPVHISKTVMNLVSNAAESMPVGGEITISTQNMHIDSPIRGYDEVMEGAYAMISVSDSGVGISPEDMSRIFEPFYTKKTMGRSGTGLGMAVVWGTVKDHHGYIDIESKEGCGTTFSLYFPLSQNETQDDQPVFSVKNIMGKGESILVVDDVEEQRHIASKILEVLGYTVETVPSGEEAVEYLKGKNADLLVLDMIMAPGMDGLETYMNIIERNPKQKAIIVSGYSADDRVKKTQDLGAGQYVKKPYTLETLGTAVRKELNK